MRRRALARLRRFGRGLYGDTEPVGNEVFELKLDMGPGYRMYFGRDGRYAIMLFAGDKKGQASDIDKAQEFWRDYQRRRGL